MSSRNWLVTASSARSQIKACSGSVPSVVGAPAFVGAPPCGARVGRPSTPDPHLMGFVSGHERQLLACTGSGNPALAARPRLHGGGCILDLQGCQRGLVLGPKLMP